MAEFVNLQVMDIFVTVPKAIMEQTAKNVNYSGLKLLFTNI